MSSEKSLNSENLLLQSQDFDTTWANDGSVGIASITGSQTAPDGTSTAWLVTADTFIGGASRLQQSISISTNTEYTMVAHVKAGTASHAFISFRGASTQSCSVTLNFSTQALTNTAFIFTNVSSSVTSLGNSWFKLTLTGTTGNSTASPIARVGISDGSAVAANGNADWDASGETIYAWGVQLSSVNSLVYDSPTTTQISRSYSPLLKTASANEPRFEYAADGQSVGLLIESQVSNLQRYGSAFASWSSSYNVSISSNSAVGPNGNLEADLIVATSTPAAHYVYDNGATLVSGTDYTASVYVKDAGQRYVQLIGASGNFGTSKWATFDLVDGSIDATNVTASAESVGNGWWRIQATMAATGSTQGNIFVTLADSATAARSNSFTGDDYSGVLLFGYQLEANSAASSLVDTGTGSSQLSRAADSCSVVDASLFDNGGGTIYAEASRNGLDTYNGIASVDDGSGSNIVQIFGNSNNFRAEIGSGGTTVANMMASGHSAGAYYKHCVAYSPSEAKYYVDGSQKGSTDTDLNIPSMSQMHFGMLNATTTGNLNGHIKRVALYNVALSDTELAALTS